MFFTTQRTIISILRMCGIRLLLIETDIWLAAHTGGDAGDDTGDVSDGAEDRAASSDIVRDVLYMLNNIYFNSGNVRYSPSVDRDRYLAGCAHGWGCCDETGDGGDGAGHRAAPSDIARDVLYMPKSFYFYSGDVRYSPSVDRDRYRAGCTHRWGWR